MALYLNPFEEEPDSFIYFEPFFNMSKENLPKNPNLFIDFRVNYTKAPEVDSDGYEDYENLETITVYQTLEYDKYWLIGGDQDQIRDNVQHTLHVIDVPPYTEIVNTLVEKLWNLKEIDDVSTTYKVDRIKVALDVTVWRLPGYNDFHVKLEVAPASEKAVKNHLKTVSVDVDEICVICMDNICVGSLEAGQMPCKHLFHRICIEQWLGNSGICPVCRAVFPVQN